MTEGERSAVDQPPVAAPARRAGPPWGWLWGAMALVAGTAIATHAVDRRILGQESAAGAEAPEKAAPRTSEEGRVELSDEARRNADLEIVAAGPGVVAETINVGGEVTLDPTRVAHVSPRVSGVVREIKHYAGDTVEKGEVLAVLDSRELGAMQRDARAAVEQVKLAEANFARLDRLRAEGIVPEKDYLAAKQALTDARIGQDAAAQALASAGSTGSGTYRLVAPIAGTIIEAQAALGEVLKDDRAVFLVAGLSTVWVELTVYSKDLPRVQVGQTVTLRAGVDSVATGSIAFVAPIASAETRTGKARVVLRDVDAAWKPGLFVKAAIVLREKKAAVVVPDGAVQRVGLKPVVFVEEEEGFEARAVTLGPAGAATSTVEIVSGVEAGERVVVKNASVLKTLLGGLDADDD